MAKTRRRLAKEKKRGLPAGAFGATELARKVKMGRASVYRYIDLGLLEPAGKRKQWYFFEEHVAVIQTIQRLLSPDFRFRLLEIKELVFSDLRWSRIAEMAAMPTPKLRRLLRRMGIRGFV